MGNSYNRFRGWALERTASNGHTFTNGLASLYGLGQRLILEKTTNGHNITLVTFFPGPSRDHGLSKIEASFDLSKNEITLTGNSFTGYPG
jgi:hypothetical protein